MKARAANGFKGEELFRLILVIDRFDNLAFWGAGAGSISAFFAARFDPDLRIHIEAEHRCPA